MFRFRISPLVLGAAMALVAGGATAEPAWTNGAARVSPEDRPFFAAGAAGGRSESIENAGWSANGNSARLIRDGGRRNTAGIAQSGRGNRATVVQTGRRNSATVNQRGTGKSALVIQSGNDTRVTVDQTGDGPAHALVITW